MWSDDAVSERSGSKRLLNAAAAGLGGVLAAALFAGVFDGGLPKPARAEEAVSLVTVAAASGPAARPSAAGLCFHGPGGELFDFAPAADRCP
jgi:hypothetical protein